MQCDNHLISDRLGDSAEVSKAQPATVAQDDAERSPSKHDPFSQSISLSTWCANLVTLVFRSRTPFAAFARVSIRLP